MMTTQQSQYFAILTAVGEAKQANANALGVPWTFASMAVGDANGGDPIPSRDQTRLMNEQRRAPLNTLSIDPVNSSIIIAEQVIPPDVGGWWIREIGLFDAAGDLVAVANCAPSFKPLLSQGTGKTQVIRLSIIVTSTAHVELRIDPSVVLATREYVDNLILHILPRDKPAGTYTKVSIDDRGIVLAGSNPTTLAGYGIDLASQPDVDAGVNDTRPVTPKKLRFGFVASLSSSGYIIFPSWLGSFVIQWTSSPAVTPGGKGSAHWPIAFPNQCLWASASAFASSGNNQAGSVNAGNGSTTTVDIFNWGAISAPAKCIGFGV